MRILPLALLLATPAAVLGCATARVENQATADSSPTTATAPGLAARSRSRTRR